MGFVRETSRKRKSIPGGGTPNCALKGPRAPLGMVGSETYEVDTWWRIKFISSEAGWLSGVDATKKVEQGGHDQIYVIERSLGDKIEPSYWVQERSRDQ